VSRLFSAGDVSDFIFSCGDLSSDSQSEIEAALWAWVEHMEAGGFEIGSEPPTRCVVFVGHKINARGAMEYAGVRSSLKRLFDDVFEISETDRRAWLEGDSALRGTYLVAMIDAHTGEEFGEKGWPT
jgi:hypothetical protein